MELYDQGLNDREIADATGLTRRAVCRWRQKLGLPAQYQSAEAKHET